MTRRHPRHHCAHCRKHIHMSPLPQDYYMVRNDLWHAHGVPVGMLCFHCFEARLGRSLTLDDLNLQAPCNGGPALFIARRERGIPEWP